MTDKQKAAFLRKEGWKWSKDRQHWWTTKPYYWFGGLEYCYRIALRRKSARDTRRLKAAGFMWDREEGWGTISGIGRAYNHLTKSEALKLLEAGNE